MITARYEVRCDICWGSMDGYYDTREAAVAGLGAWERWATNTNR